MKEATQTLPIYGLLTKLNEGEKKDVGKGDGQGQYSYKDWAPVFPRGDKTTKKGQPLLTHLDNKTFKVEWLDKSYSSRMAICSNLAKKHLSN